MVIRISFSNLFKEFKSTSTWLQFPYVSSLTSKENVRDPTTKPARLSASRSEQKDVKPTLHIRWTLLALDLKAILSQYLHSNYTYLKNVKLCSNLLVKNVFTSDIEYSPLVAEGSKTLSNDKRAGSCIQPLPKEMSFLVHKGQSFEEVYDYVRFPSETVDQVRTVVSRPTHLKGSHPVITSVVQEELEKVESGVGYLKSGRSKERHTGREKHGACTRKSAYADDSESKGEVLSTWTKAERKGDSCIEHSSAKEDLVQVSEIEICKLFSHMQSMYAAYMHCSYLSCSVVCGVQS